jgi:hypothetical protein
LVQKCSAWTWIDGQDYEGLKAILITSGSVDLPPIALLQFVRIISPRSLAITTPITIRSMLLPRRVPSTLLASLPLQRVLHRPLVRHASTSSPNGTVSPLFSRLIC